MSLIDTLFNAFEDANALLCGDPLNIETLKSHQEKLMNAIAQKDAQIIEAQKKESSTIGKYSAELRDLKTLLLPFQYIEAHPDITQSLYAWLIDSQLSAWNDQLSQQRKHLLSTELASLMTHFLENKHKDAIQYYNAHKEELEKASPAVKRHMEDQQKKPAKTKSKTVADWKSHFGHALKRQADAPAAILPLAIHYYDEPHAFAALLFWLLEHEVTPKTIVHSGLLHRLFSAHAAFISEPTLESNPVVSIYETLHASENIMARKLINLANNTSAYVSGNPGEEILRGFQGYDLTGQLHTNETKASTLAILSSAQIAQPTTSINPHHENIRALSTVFSSTFLRLLATTPEVATQLTPEQWQDYFSEVVQTIGDEVTSFPAWFDLYALLTRYQSPLSTQTYARIIDTALLHIQEIEWDNELIHKLNTLTNRSTLQILIERIKTLIAQLIACIVANTISLTLDSYHSIEDVWLKTNRSINFIKIIYGPFYRFSPGLPDDIDLLPKNIYLLQITVLEKCRNYCDTLDIMLSSQMPGDNSKAHEKRLLLEWLALEPNTVAQNFIVNRLFEKFTIETLLASSPQEKNLFSLACQVENELAITHLLKNENGLLTKEIIHEEFRLAASNGKTSTIKLLLALRNDIAPNQEGIYFALSSMLMISQPDDILPWFLNLKGDNALDSVMLARALHLAIRQEKWQWIAPLCRSNYRLDKNDIIVAITEAKEADKTEVITDLCGLTGKYPFDPEIAGHALVRAASWNNLNFVSTLCALIGNNPINQCYLVEALKMTTRIKYKAGIDIVKFLCNLKSTNAPNRESITQALIYCVLENQVEMITFFCAMSGDNAPNTESTTQALGWLHDIKIGHYNQKIQTMNQIFCASAILCNLQGDKAPNEEAVIDALHIACDRNQLGFIASVCGVNTHSPNHARLASVFNYLIAQVHNTILDYVIRLVITQPSDIANPMILSYLKHKLANKGPTEKYIAIVHFYQCYIRMMSIERAILLFSLINKNCEALNIDTTLKYDHWALISFNHKKNHLPTWEAACDKMRQLIFKKWKAAFTQKGITPEKKKALINIFHDPATYPFNQEIIRPALMSAVDAADLDLITAIYEFNRDHSISQSFMASALIAAQVKNNIPIIQFFCQLNPVNAPHQRAISRALSSAVRNGKVDIATYYCSLTTENAPNCESTTNALHILHEIQTGDFKPDVGHMNNIFSAAAMLCHLEDEKAPKEEMVIDTLHIACDKNQLAFIIAVCGIHTNLPNQARMAAALCYATSEGKHSIANDLISQVLTQPSNIANSMIMDYLTHWLHDKSPTEKYIAIANFYRLHIAMMSVEGAAVLFDLIDKNNAALDIDTTPRSEPWTPAFLSRESNHAEAWATAWGEIRQLIFDKWQAQITHNEITPELKQTLIDLFQGCGQAGSTHHKLMGMRRTTGKPNSKTSRLIEADIIKVKDQLVMKSTMSLFSPRLNPNKYLANGPAEKHTYNRR